MANTTPTAQALINVGRQLADAQTPTPTTDFVTDTELLERLNTAYRELVDFIASCSDGAIELLATSATVTSPLFTLPADFYRLIAVDLPDTSRSNRWVDAKSFNFRERNRECSFSYPEYRLVGNALLFTPVENPPASARVWYIPSFTAVANLSSTLNTFGGWDDFLTAELAIYIATKEDADTALHVTRKKAAMERIALVCKDLVLTGTQTIAKVEYQVEEFIDFLATLE